MAGGKETPRQKMIGMMYLVLTALLAMNVSASILEKFAFLNGGMEKSRDTTIGRNENKITDIHSSIKQRGNKPDEIQIGKEVDEIRASTNDLLLYIEELKAELINRSGGLSDGSVAVAKIPVSNTLGGMIPGAKNRDVVMEYMLGGNKKGEAYTLKRKIEEYVSYINKHSVNGHETFAYDGKEDPLAKNDPEQNGKDFAELNFEETPVVAALAVLSQMQSKITSYESDVLNEKRELLGISDWKFDHVSLGVRTQNGFVAAGTKYKADMYLSATNTQLKPKMKWKLLGEDNMTVIDSASVDPMGVGSLEFTARSGNYDKDGNAKKKWVGELTVMGPDGNWRTFYDTIEYVVTKPVMQVMNASVTSLYRNCGNQLNIQVPALGEAYQPVFGVTGGTKINGAQKGYVTIIPSERKVNLSVSSGGTVVGTQTFEVLPVPLPTVKIMANGKEAPYRDGFATCPSALNVVFIADKAFQKALPNETKYFPLEVEVLLARGKKVVDRVKSKGAKINISRFRSVARSGDRIIVEVMDIRRKNFRNEQEKVRFEGGLIYTIPIQ